MRGHVTPMESATDDRGDDHLLGPVRLQLDNHDQGDRVKPTEHIAKSASTAKAGLCAMLGGLLRAKGSGAPVRRRVLAMLSVLVTTLGGALAFTATSALAVSPPTIEEAFVTDVASTSATLQAKLNPQGGETTYVFEYAKAGGSFAPVAEPEGHGSIPEGTAGVPLEVHVQHGLEPGAPYQFRLVATHAGKEEVAGEPVSFITPRSGGSFVLPDGRAYEMVTPPQKQGALIRGFEVELDIRASGVGNAIADAASVPTEAEPQSNPNTRPQILSVRGAAGWSTQVIAPPHPVAGPALLASPEYQLFSDDLSRAIVQPFSPGFEQLSPLASEPTAYLRTLFFNGNVSERCEAAYTSAASCFAPLVSSANDTASPFRPFGELDSNGECVEHAGAICGANVVAGTPDLSHVVVSSSVALTETPAPNTSPENGTEDLYEYSGGRLQLISILPGQQEGAESLHLAGETSGFALGRVAHRHAISNDGRYVVLEQENAGLYLRDVAKGETLRLDVGVEGGSFKPEASVEPVYMTASGDASRVFFLDSAQLTADSGAQGSAPDLYECAVSEVGGKDRCALTDLTPKTGGESAGVAGVLGTSEDGSYVYFAAAGALTPGVTSVGNCALGQGCNVYVRHEGVTRRVVGLSREDEADWETTAPGFPIGGLTGQPVRVSPDGRWLAFLSNRDLTGYDNRPGVPNQCTTQGSPVPCPEVYLYGAGAGTLSCASCDPTGARPAGGASVPGWTRSLGELPFYQPRYLSSEGRLFFNSSDALVPKDVSGQSEVFEYEPQGAPQSAPESTRCGPAAVSGSEVFKPGRSFVVEGGKGSEGAGCVALISSGAASEGSQFLEASENGGDVFFLTAEKLAPQDFDSAPDVYDAHECTGSSPCIAPPASQPPACDNEASCKAPPSPQPSIYGAPSSATFSGPGNLSTPPPPAKVTKKTVKCKKGFVKNKKGKCVRKKSKKTKQARKASIKGRA
jgi:hypothetical protein